MSSEITEVELKDGSKYSIRDYDSIDISAAELASLPLLILNYILYLILLVTFQI